jgi:flagellar basal-body rod protein FlgC
MGLFDGYNVVASGMGAQRTRVDIISANIANAKTTHTEEGGPYKKKNVVFEEVLMESQKGAASNGDKNPNGISASAVGVKAILESKDRPVMRFEPGHPDANAEGYVAYPNINPVVEMVDLMEAVRSYEANVTAFTSQKTIDNKTIDILKG